MKVFENDADWEERAWELAKKLVSIDSSDPGAYEGEIGEWLYEYLSRCCERWGGSLADQIPFSVVVLGNFRRFLLVIFLFLFLHLDFSFIYNKFSMPFWDFFY